MYLTRASRVNRRRGAAPVDALRMSVLVLVGLVRPAASYLLASGGSFAPRPCVFQPVTFSLQRPAKTRTRERLELFCTRAAHPICLSRQ